MKKTNWIFGILPLLLISCVRVKDYVPFESVVVFEEYVERKNSYEIYLSVQLNNKNEDFYYELGSKVVVFANVGANSSMYNETSDIITTYVLQDENDCLYKDIYIFGKFEERKEISCKKSFEISRDSLSKYECSIMQLNAMILHENEELAFNTVRNSGGMPIYVNPRGY